MIRLQRAVFFMEEEPAAGDSKPLMLNAVLSCPILSWMSNQLQAGGVQRFFVCAGYSLCIYQLRDLPQCAGCGR